MVRFPEQRGMSVWGPFNADDEKALGDAREIIFDYKKSRNPKFHRKGMALFRLVFDNQDTYQTIEQVMTEVKLQVGHYEEHVTLGGKLIYKPKSIAFDEMDEFAFKEFMNNAIDVILKFFCKGMDRKILEEIVRF